METVSQFDYQGMLNNPNDFNQFNGQNGFPNISFVNLADLQGDGGIPNKQKLKKKKKAEDPKPVFNIKDIPAPHKIKASLDEYVVGQEKAKKVEELERDLKHLSYLDEKSNIIKFQNLFDIKPSKNGIEDILNFVFKLKKCENYDELSENTSLQKCIKEFLKNGGIIYEGYGELKNKQ